MHIALLGNWNVQGAVEWKEAAWKQMDSSVVSRINS